MKYQAFAANPWEVLGNVEKRDLEAGSSLYCETSSAKSGPAAVFW